VPARELVAGSLETRPLLSQNQRTQKKDFGNRGKRDDTWTDYRSRNVTWENISDKQQQDGTLNEAFESYYKEQGICPAEEWSEFMQTLVKPLPIVFRINGSGKFADALRQRLEDDFFSKFAKERLVIDGVSIPRYSSAFLQVFTIESSCLRASWCAGLQTWSSL
jgi:hypothetical protein